MKRNELLRYLKKRILDEGMTISMALAPAVTQIEQFLLDWGDAFETLYNIDHAVSVSLAAPSSYEELLADAVNWSSRGMFVSGEGNDQSIFKHPRYNKLFRAHHDFTHWAHRLDFTLEGEADVAILQADAIVPDAANDYMRALVDLVLDIEINYQGRHYQKTGEFIGDQRQFMITTVGTLLDNLKPLVGTVHAIVKVNLCKTSVLYFYDNRYVKTVYLDGGIDNGIGDIIGPLSDIEYKTLVRIG